MINRTLEQTNQYKIIRLVQYHIRRGKYHAFSLYNINAKHIVLITTADLSLATFFKSWRQSVTYLIKYNLE